VVSREDVKALVEPFPLVPVMCNTFNRFKSFGLDETEMKLNQPISSHPEIRVSS